MNIDTYMNIDACITVDSVLRIDKKNHPQVYLEECVNIESKNTNIHIYKLGIEIRFRFRVTRFRFRVRKVIFVFSLQLITIMSWNVFFEGTILKNTYVLKTTYVLKWMNNLFKIYGCWLVWLLLYIFMAAK